MKAFFKWAIKLGLRIIIIGLIIWIVFFSLRYFFPESFNLVDSKISQGNNLPFRYRVYNFLFNRGEINNELSDVKKVNFYDQESKVWGRDKDSSSSFNKNKLKDTDNYVYLNDPNYLISQDFKFDDELLSQDELNTLNPSTTISGKISLNYLSAPYFYVDLYDKDGNYLYSLLASGIIDNYNNFMSIKVEANQNLNYTNYNGKGFLVIWSDNRESESILITKVNIIGNFADSTSTTNN